MVEPQRLFFALWPDELTRARLADLSLPPLPPGARRVPVQNLHLTLVFLGAVEEARRACVEAAADAVRAGPFDLVFERLGWWPGPRVLWLSPVHTPEVLRDLVQALQDRLRACGFAPEARPYQAHLTLARKVSRAPAMRQPEPIDWPVGELCLVRSETLPAGARYSVVRRWPLGPRPSGVSVG